MMDLLSRPSADELSLAQVGLPRHITVLNKVEEAEAESLFEAISHD